METEYSQKDAKIDLSMTVRFLSIFSQVDQNNRFTFQIFKDKKEQRAAFPRIIHGTLEELKNELVHLNCEEHYGIFVTVNATDFQGRKSENIVKVRAFFVDLDGSPLDPVLSAPISPHVIVESSPNRYHAYWIVNDAPLDKFSLVQEALICKFNGDNKVKDLSRVMRLPGFLHLKGTPFLTKIISENSAPALTFEKFCQSFEVVLSSENKKDCRVKSDLPNFVLSELKKCNLLREKDSNYGSWTIRCPWEHQHSTIDKGTKYYEPFTNGYSGHGFKCFHEHCKNRDFQDLFNFLELGNSLPSEPIPLYRKLEPALPYPIDAMGDILGNAVKSLHRIIKAPDAICAQSVLGAVALICQPYANVEIDGREYPLSLNLLTVAESGDRKSSTDKIAILPISDRQERLIKQYGQLLKEFKLKHAQWDIQKNKFLKEQPDGIDETFDLEEPVQPLKQILLFEEPTYEGLVKYLETGQPSVGLFSDEGAGFLGGYSMGRDNIQRSIAGFSSIWDGKPISRTRGGDGSSNLYGRRVSLHLMIQEIILSQLMGNPIIEKQGFLPRFLISYPQSMAGTRSYVEENIKYDSAIVRYWKQLETILEMQYPVDPFPSPQNELKPRQLPLSQNAKRVWIEYYNQNEQQLGPGMRLSSVKRLANRAPEHVLRLAGNLAIFENPNISQIDSEFILMAIRLMEFYLNESIRISGYLSIHPDLVKANDLLEWCWKHKKQVITLQNIYQYGPKEIREKDKAIKIITLLVGHGWATPTTFIDENGKQHKQAWKIREQMTEG